MRKAIVYYGIKYSDSDSDSDSGVVTWHLPRPGVQPCQYKGYTHKPNSIVWNLYSVYIHDCNATNYSK